MTTTTTELRSRFVAAQISAYALALGSFAILLLGCRERVERATVPSAIVFRGIYFSVPDSLEVTQFNEDLNGYMAVSLRFALRADTRCSFEILKATRKASDEPEIRLNAESPQGRTLEAELSKAWKLQGPLKYVDQQLGGKHFSGVRARTISGTNIFRGYLSVDKELVLVELSYSEPAVPASILDLMSSIRGSRSGEPETEITYRAAGFSFVAPMSCSFLPDKDRMHRPRLYLASWDGHWMIRFRSPVNGRSDEMTTNLALKTGASDAPGLKNHYGLGELPPFAFTQVGTSRLYSTTIDKPTFSLIHGFVVFGKWLIPVEVVLAAPHAAMDDADQQSMKILGSVQTGDRLAISQYHR